MTNEYVYPFQEFGLSGFGEKTIIDQSQGMTKREHFALAIYCAQYSGKDTPSTRDAIQSADELLKELNK